MKNDLNPNGYLCCAICDAKILFRNTDKTLNFDNYKEVSFLIKRKNIDGFGLMTIGFCINCQNKANSDNSLFDMITESVKEGWRIEFDHDKVPQDLRDKYWNDWQDMKIVDWYKGV